VRVRAPGKRLVAAVACLLALTSAGAAGAGEVQPQAPIQTGANPPGWARTTSRCVVELTDARHPSGVVGYIGYNASLLTVVRHKRVSCPEAKRLARAEWTRGPLRRPLRWRYARAWRSTSGSAYIGDFVGVHGARRVEFFAVH
jgi:hypothetical protein